MKEWSATYVKQQANGLLLFEVTVDGSARQFYCKPDWVKDETGGTVIRPDWAETVELKLNIPAEDKVAVTSAVIAAVK